MSHEKTTTPRGTRASGSTGRMRAVGWRLMVGALIASSAGVGGTHQLVDAADPVAAPACDGTTSTSGGVLNTPTSPITLHDTAAGNVGQVTDLAAGKTVFLYDNKGTMVVHPDGTYQSVVGGIPLCGVRLDPVSRSMISEWSFCTDEALYGCANIPPSPVGPNPKLTSDDQAIIAFLLFHGDTSTKRSRAILQLQTWCISEHVAAGAVNNSASAYFSGQFAVAGGDSESAPLTTEEATCFDQTFRDAAIAAIPASTTFTLTGPATTTNAPGTVTFALTTNFSGEVTLAVTGADAFAVCPGDTSGAVLAGSTLTLLGPSAVTLCAQRSTAGTVAIDADAKRLTRSSITWINAQAGCQYFSTFSRTLSETGTAAATAEFTTISTTTTSTTTTAPSTTTTEATATTTPLTTTSTTTSATTSTTTGPALPTTTDAGGNPPTPTSGPRGLPVTGSNSASQLWLTGALIALGGVLVQLARRRRPTRV